MSRDGSISLDWGNSRHRFRLGIGELRELQEEINRPRAKIGAPLIGPGSLWRSLQTYDAWKDEVREVIRLGLIGGGMKPLDALGLVRRYVDERPLVESSVHAVAVLGAALFGPPEEPVEGNGEAAKAMTEESAPSHSLHSTETGSSSDLPPSKSTE